jgi:hypothetical protein
VIIFGLDRTGLITAIWPARKTSGRLVKGQKAGVAADERRFKTKALAFLNPRSSAFISGQ